MKLIYKLTLLSLALTCTNSYSVEITPLYAYRDGGDFTDESDTNNKTTISIDNTAAYGVLIAVPYERGKTLELYYSHQSTHLDSIDISNGATTAKTNIPITIDYLHIGGTAPISEDKDLPTFVSGGLGFTYMNPDFPDTQAELRPSMSIGIGLKYPVIENVAIRLETRGFATLFNNNSTLFCNGGCDLQVSGNGFFQFEVFTGLAIQF